MTWSGREDIVLLSFPPSSHLSSHCMATPWFTIKYAKYNEQNINATCKVLVQCFISWNKRSQKMSIHTKSFFLSKFVRKFVFIPFSEHFSFAKIIHIPGRCCISRSWLNSMVITHVHLVLETKKATLKCVVLSHNTADCRNVHQGCCQIIECPFIYHKPPPTSF
jgi:hypothetical protein